jgi:hypothetical protein
MPTKTKTRTVQAVSPLAALEALEAERDEAGAKLREVRREAFAKTERFRELDALRRRRKHRVPGEYRMTDSGLVPLDKDSEAGQIQKQIDDLGRLDYGEEIGHLDRLAAVANEAVANYMEANRDALAQEFAPQIKRARARWYDALAELFAARDEVFRVAARAEGFGGERLRFDDLTGLCEQLQHVDVLGE